MSRQRAKKISKDIQLKGHLFSLEKGKLKEIKN